MRDQVKDPAPSKAARAVGGLAWLLTAAGVVALAWCTLIAGDTYLAQRAARLALDHMASSRPARTAAPKDPSRAPVPATHADPVLHRGTALAALSIPRVHLSAVVLHGSDAQTLRRGPGHLESSPLPGETGNVVIAGHRDSFFRPLRDIEVGDDILLDTPDTHSRYRVTSLRVVRADDLSVIGPEAEPVLTLITCFPFWVLGNAPDRFVVRARRVDDVVTPAVASAVAAPHAPKVLASPAAPASDDALIRESIERFRVVYNGRLGARNDVRPEGPLRFAACSVVITDRRATASCDEVLEPGNDLGARLWTFALRHDPAGWAVTSIVSEP